MEILYNAHWNILLRNDCLCLVVNPLLAEVLKSAFTAMQYFSKQIICNLFTPLFTPDCVREYPVNQCQLLNLIFRSVDKYTCTKVMHFLSKKEKPYHGRIVEYLQCKCGMLVLLPFPSLWTPAK